MGAYLLTAYYSQEEEYMNSESKRVPIGVWIFWAIFGLLILGFLASRYTHFGNAINFAVSFISVLASAGAAVAAYLAVKELRDERKEERSNRKPYFSFISGEVGTAEDDEAQYSHSGFVRAECRNVGTNPATDLTITVTFLMDVDNHFATEVATVRTVNDVASGFDYAINRGGLHIDTTQHHYVVFELEYYDAIYGTRHHQTFYQQWNGLDPYDETQTSRALYPITREVKPLVQNMLAEG